MTYTTEFIMGSSVDVLCLLSNSSDRIYSACVIRDSFSFTVT